MRGSGRGLGKLLVGCVAVETLWSAALALSQTRLALHPALTLFLEAVRPLTFSCLLLWMLHARARIRPLLLTAALATVISVVQFLAPLLNLDLEVQFGSGLLAAVLSVLCVEQVYRNAAEDSRWAVKFLCLGLLAIFVFDVVLYTDGLLFGRFEFGWWAARGFANALVVPLVAITASRVPDWRLDLRLSREVVFHSATLLVSGVFLLAVSAIGYGLRFAGGEWGGVAQLVVLFGAAVGLVALIASGHLRAKAKVLLTKHFFRYRYDYRNEWLKLTDLIAAPEEPGSAAGSLAYRSLRGLTDLVESPGGSLWLRGDNEQWVARAHKDQPEHPPLSRDDPLPAFLAERNWIVDVPEWREEPGIYDDLQLPDWMARDTDSWLVIPLVLHQQLIGFALLQRPVAPVPLDWEVRDVLKTAARQIAGYLAVQATVEKLVQARQFDSFNRMSAFVVHDLKNLVAQLSLLLKNAAKHRDNPEFQSDMLETVENVLDRMQGLLRQLRVGTRPIEQPAALPLLPVLESAVHSKQGHRVEPSLHIEETARNLEVVAHRDRLERVLGHLVQNAQEATPVSGSVRVAVRRDGDHALIEVIDTGRGMSREFIETSLFRPFSSTKEHGMGIGAFESREYINELGGSLKVSSTEGQGTTFSLRLPVKSRQPLPVTSADDR